MATPLPVSSGAWRCRICSYERFHRVAVTRKNGARYETEFFACSQCSVMFLNPTQFNMYSNAAQCRVLTSCYAAARAETESIQGVTAETSLKPTKREIASEP